MYHVESYLRVRRAVMVEGMSIREASPDGVCILFGTYAVERETV